MKVTAPVTAAFAAAVGLRRLMRGSRPRVEPGPLRRRLHVMQAGNHVVLNLSVRSDITVVGIWGRDASDQWTWLSAVVGGEKSDADIRTYQGKINLDGIVPRLSGTGQPDLDASTADTLGGALNLFLEIERDVNADSPLAETVRNRDPDAVGEPECGAGPDGADMVRVRYRFALGRFADTHIGELSTVTTPHGTAAVYPNRNGGLSIAVNQPLNPYGRIHVSRLRIRDGLLEMRGTVHSRHVEIDSAALLLKGRTTGTRSSAPLHVIFDEAATRQKFGLRRYHFTVQLDVAGLVPDGRDDTLDAWVEIQPAQGPEPYQVRVGKTRYLVQLLSRPGWAQYGDRTASLTPYYTYKAQNTSFHLELFDSDAHRMLRKRLRTQPLRRITGTRKDTWLLGERPYKAQDNGLQLFRYLREAHPEINAYYVIEADSPERRNLDGLDNVVTYRSTQHIDVALRAGRFAGTHHADYLYPLRTQQFRRAVGGVKVFLQHGVMGTKWLAPMYGRNVSTFETDLFIVSSEREKEYIVSDFGYRPQEVAVTGLARFDTLLIDDVDVKPRQILVIPTWREWLQDPDRFLESEYYERWMSFLTAPAFQSLVDTHGLEVIFCLHPNMQQHREAFSSIPARIIMQGEVDVQHLLKESALMITDYSSVGFDFSFLHKPVVYYQFDRDRFLGKMGSHLDLDRELPGQVTETPDELLAAVSACVDNGNRMDAHFMDRADRFIAHRDTDSRERIVQAIKRARRADSVLERVGKSETFQRAVNVYRRSKYYFPVMKMFYRLVKLTPADPNLIVFESGVGKQYADSPRYIYEELLRRGDQRRKVWAYNGKFPVDDAGTTVVKRLSPKYYWYLGRAKYWVNNQSFPHYIHRRRNGVYLQTWHGTPLKRMALDLEHVHGRDAGYLDRVAEAASQWSVLVSSSSYMTHIMRSAFQYGGKVLEAGFPRNDLLASADGGSVKSRVRAEFGIGPEKKVVLYAPTFRDNQSTGRGRFGFDLPIDLDEFGRRFGADTILMIRTHVLVQDSFTVPAELESCIMDVSRFPDIQELYMASDVLITDYSSVFFDFANLPLPIIFYAPDLESYRDELRGFYIEYDEQLPGPIVTTQEELFHQISSSDEILDEYAEKRRIFLERFNPHEDGASTQRVVDSVFGT